MRIDVVQLQWVAKKVSQEAADVRSNADQMNKVRDGVETGWKSQYTMNYIQELEKVQSNIYKVSNNLQKIAQTMYQIAEETKRIEEENKAKLKFGR